MTLDDLKRSVGQLAYINPADCLTCDDTGYVITRSETGVQLSRPCTDCALGIRIATRQEEDRLDAEDEQKEKENQDRKTVKEFRQAAAGGDG